MYVNMINGFDMIAAEAKTLMSQYGKNGIPFLFILDYELKDPIVLRLDEISPGEIVFDIQGFTNSSSSYTKREEIGFKKYPIPFESYKIAFHKVCDQLYNGNTYLLNLTFPTRISCSLGLDEIFYSSKAKFKLLVRDRFVVFSPESFVRIDGQVISSYPMKGTIDASLPNAEERIISDKKEQAEHATIVDLIRNDISMVADNVKVVSYRYIDRIVTNDKTLLQVSSEISGRLPADYNERLGDILFQLLPAGSITGAPKKKTVEIIKTVESYDRGYYTGVFGYFDGKRLESGIMIRFIENADGILYYKSGGGITAMSNADSEYMEMIDKVYVPFA
jgi:para-aminobenzoate synthetase component I